MNKMGLYVVGGLVGAGAIVGGAVVMTRKGGVDVPGGAGALAASLTPAKQKVLRGQLRQIGADQRARAAQVARIAAAPKVQKSKRLQPIVQRLAQKQAETALVLARTDSYLAQGDPRVAAYERQLGADLAELDRLAHVLDVAAQRERLVAQPAPVYQPVRPGAPPPPPPAAARRPGPALGAAIVALDRSYDNSRRAYQTFDYGWRQTVAQVPPATFPQTNVRRELATMPQSEVYYAMGHYLAPSPREVGFYAQAMHIQAPTYQQVNAYAAMDVYQQNSVQQNNVNTGDTNITINLDNSTTVDQSDNNIDNSNNEIAKLEQEYNITPEKAEEPVAVAEMVGGGEIQEANLYGGGGGGAGGAEPAGDPNPSGYDPGPAAGGGEPPPLEAEPAGGGGGGPAAPEPGPDPGAGADPGGGGGEAPPEQ